MADATVFLSKAEAHPSQSYLRGELSSDETGNAA